MLTLFLLIIVLLGALAALPYIHAPVSVEEYDDEEPTLRIKSVKISR